ncbi:MAG TPA: GTP-binding protein [Methyloprofundus sp.]|nr:GTP-binding protein [Methyloprofundus sp.]HIL77359.1 GTP-binding protein [Methylococcales bacterium]
MVMGFLGVGKTTAILDLLNQKPKNENWAVLVNEFGKIGMDGAIYSAAGVTVKEIAGGCLCCAVGLPFQVSLNRLLKEIKPDRLLIEPTGLGHPKKVLDMLVNNSFKEVLDVRASVCLVDPEKLKDSRYTTHGNFIDQIAMSDVLVANKMDLAGNEAINLFHQWSDNSHPEKAMIAQTQQGQLDVAWLDIPRNPHRLATYPDAHKVSKLSAINQPDHSFSNSADGYQSMGHIFPAQVCFDYQRLSDFLGQLNAERIKGIINTNSGWFIINGTDQSINYLPTTPANQNRIEIITQQNDLTDILTALNLCRFTAQV